MTTLMSKARRRCDKLCYGSAHDGTHCKCICGGKCHGQGLLRAAEIVRTQFYPDWEGAPDWQFNMKVLKQGVLEASKVAGGEVHSLRIQDHKNGRGFVARCTCGFIAGRVRNAKTRADYGRAQRAAQTSFDQHIKELRDGNRHL